MKFRSAKIIKYLIFSAFILTSLSAFSAKKITGGIIGCEADMYYGGGMMIRDTILRLRNFNNKTTIRITRIVSHTASGKIVYDTATGMHFPVAFMGTLPPNAGALIPFSKLTNNRVDPGLNVAQVLFYWVPLDQNATVGLKVAAVKRIRSDLVNGNHTNHCHIVADQEVPVGSEISSEPVLGQKPAPDQVTEHVPGSSTRERT